MQLTTDQVQAIQDACGGTLARLANGRYQLTKNDITGYAYPGATWVRMLAYVGKS